VSYELRAASDWAINPKPQTPNPKHSVRLPYFAAKDCCMSYNYLPLDRKWLHFDQVKNLLDFDQLISITFDAHERILTCRAYLDQKMEDKDRLYYGINTGFGFLQDVKIDASQVEQLQYNLLVSHACGLGEEVPAEIVKLMLMLKVKSLSYGYSGVQIDTVIRLMYMYNQGVCPSSIPRVHSALPAIWHR
jgi:histidine ammonia-lyase